MKNLNINEENIKKSIEELDDKNLVIDEEQSSSNKYKEMIDNLFDKDDELTEEEEEKKERAKRRRKLRQKILIVAIFIVLLISTIGCAKKNKDYSYSDILDGLENGQEDTNIDENIPLILQDEALNERFTTLGIGEKTINNVESSFINCYSKDELSKCNDGLYMLNYSLIKSLLLETFNITNDKVTSFGINGEYRNGESGTEDFYDIHFAYVDDFGKEHSYNLTTGNNDMRNLLIGARKAYHNQLEEDEIAEFYYNLKNLLSKKIIYNNENVVEGGVEYDGTLSLENDKVKEETINNSLEGKKVMKIKLR